MSFKLTDVVFMPLRLDRDLSITPEMQAARLANACLETYLATLPRVYGNIKENEWIWGEPADDVDTHTAVLYGVQPIEKPKPCDHTIGIFFDHSRSEISCMDCRKKLKPKNGWTLA